MSFDDAWHHVLARDALQLAGDAQAWTRGRAQLIGFSVPVGERAARAHLARVAERIAGIPGVALLPEEHWHVTVKFAGFQVIRRVHEDDILRQDVPRLAEEARAALAAEPAFEAQLGLANAFADAVFVEVWDNGRLRALNERLGALPFVARQAFDGAAYLPHVSLASFRSNEGLDALKEALAALRREPAGPALSVARVELVKSWWVSDEEPPETQVLATYQLRSAS